MKRRPVRKEIKSPIIQCMCSTSYCLGNFDNARNSCPIKCLKQNFSTLHQNSSDNTSTTLTKNATINDDSNSPEGISYSETSCVVEDGGSGTAGASRYPFTSFPRSCSCPICKCKCNFSCRIVDVPKIMLQKKSEATKKTKQRQYIIHSLNKVLLQFF